LFRSKLWGASGGLVFLLQCVWFRRYQVDDAFITYRYARNWAEGLGPVMNAGERIEGVSNLPWAALLAMITRIGVVPHVAGPVLGVLCGLGCVLLTVMLAHRWTGDRVAGNTAGLLLGAAAPVAIWSVSGLETLGYTLSVLTFFLLATDRQWRDRGLLVGLGLGVVAAMRPEGFLVAMAWAVYAKQRSVLRRLTPVVLLGFACLWIPLLGLRLWYYGEWLANPTLAKSSLAFAYWGAGSVYVAKFVVASLPLLALSFVGAFRRGASAVGTLALAWVVLQLSFAVAVGGERFPAYRFLVPALPMLAFLAARSRVLFAAPAGAGQSRKSPQSAQSLQSLKRRSMIVLGLLASMGLMVVWKPQVILPMLEPVTEFLRLQRDSLQHQERLLAEARFLGLAVAGLATVLVLQRLRPGAAAILVAAWMILASRTDPSLTSCRQPGSAAYHGRVVGEWLHGAAAVDVVVATNGAGALPYFSRLPVIDMLGLTDSHIARSPADRTQWIGHERGDGAYVLARRPDIIVLGGPEGSATPWPFPGDQQIADSVVFAEDYELQRVALPDFVFTYWRARQGRMPPQRDSEPGS